MKTNDNDEGGDNRIVSPMLPHKSGSSSSLLRVSDFCASPPPTPSSARRRRRRRRSQSYIQNHVVNVGSESASSSICDSYLGYGSDDVTVKTTNDGNSFDVPSSPQAHNLIDLEQNRHENGGYVSTNTTTDYEDERLISVSLSILHSVPCSSIPVTSNSGGKKQTTAIDDGHDGLNHHKSTSTNDVFATVYTNDINVLLKLQIFDGNICKLIHRHDSTTETPTITQSTSEWLPVIIKYIPAESLDRYSTTAGNNCSTTRYQQNDMIHYGESTTKSSYTIYIPPTMAASIGFYDCIPSSPPQDSFYLYPYHHNQLTQRSSLDDHNNASYKSIPIASEASLMEIGSDPVSNGLPTFSLFSELCLAANISSEDGITKESDPLPLSSNVSNTSEARLSQKDSSMMPEQNKEDGTDSKKQTSSQSYDSMMQDSSRKRLIHQSREQLAQHHISSLQQYFYQSIHEGENENDTSTKKEVNRLVRKGSFISILLDVSDDYNRKKHSTKRMNVSSWTSNVRVYKVVDAKQGDYSVSSQKSGVPSTTISSDMDHALHSNDCFWISPKTKLTLLSKEQTQYENDDTQRLPQKSIVKSFYVSTTVRHHKPQDLPQDVNSSHRMVQKIHSFHHPNLHEVVHKLLLLGRDTNCGMSNIGNRSILSSHTLHLIGREENNIRDCVSAAADVVGMNIIHIDGLAAFGYRYQVMTCGNEEQATKSKIVSGSLTDKLSALRQVFDVARYSSPCIIHLGNFHQELSHFQDVDMCHDEEERFLTSLNEEMLEGTFCRTGIYDSTCSLPVPRVALVLSTSNEFSKSGPFSSTLVNQSIHIVPPDERYTQSLWSDNDTFVLVKTQLMGKSAREIEYLGNEMKLLKQDNYDSLVKLENDRDMCQSDIVCLALKQLTESLPSFFSLHNSQDSKSSIPTVRWEDIGGLRHVRDEVMDAIELPLHHPELFKGQRRSGILLFGPPGNGKTLVAKAVATECNIPFISVRGPELLGSYVGESEGNVRAVFDLARRAAKNNDPTGKSIKAAILFFDEIDSLAPRRGGVGDGGGVMERVVATILGELDKETTSNNPDDDNISIFVIGATNRPDLLDPSLLSPGRFDRLVYLGLAQERIDRISILASQTRKFRFEQNMTSLQMAETVIDSMPDCLSGADFSAIASGALTKALRRKCEEVDRKVCEMKEKCHDRIDEGVVLRDWKEEDLSPRITKEDLISAASDIVPSVDAKSLQKYDDLKRQFCAFK